VVLFAPVGGAIRTVYFRSPDGQETMRRPTNALISGRKSFLLQSAETYAVEVFSARHLRRKSRWRGKPSKNSAISRLPPERPLMNVSRLPTFAFVALLVANLTAPAYAVTIDWVTVGDPNNAADTTGYGTVANAYRIGKYEVTIQQYTDFLNAVAQSDPYSLYDPVMANNGNIAGISQSGTSGEFSYSVIGPLGTTPAGASSPGNRPITFVSWFDAARFANWMQNGQGSASSVFVSPVPFLYPNRPCG